MSDPIRSLVHLHGFCSSPKGTKATFLRERFLELGFDLVTPDLNQPSFFHLTITRQVETVQAAVTPLDRPLVLMGSSMGALVALHYAERWGGVDRLVLFAPALDLLAGLEAQLGDEFLQRWKTSGSALFQHFGSGRLEPLSFELIPDLAHYPTTHLSRPTPTLILQGLRDELCPPEGAIRYAEHRPYVKLVLLDTDHYMNDQLDRTYEEIRRFLDL
ncbi:MAG: alpha/beta fold hydrolase [Bradymonadales bacterium]|nr:alpha/beta fold hydrolase [Bradymonadales bacterium]